MVEGLGFCYGSVCRVQGLEDSTQAAEIQQAQNRSTTDRLSGPK